MPRAPTAVELAQREAAWRDAIADAERTARERLDDIGRRLGISERVLPILTQAGLEIARQYAAEYTYANYTHRTGQPWPEEWRELDEEERQTAWRLAIDIVNGSLRVEEGRGF